MKHFVKRRKDIIVVIATTIFCTVLLICAGGEGEKTVNNEAEIFMDGGSAEETVSIEPIEKMIVFQSPEFMNSMEEETTVDNSTTATQEVVSVEETTTTVESTEETTTIQETIAVVENTEETEYSEYGPIGAYTEYDVYLLAQILYCEVGGENTTEMSYCGSVIINRARSNVSDFVNVHTIWEVLYQPGQYGRYTLSKIEGGIEPTQANIDVARGLLNGTIECLPADILYQVTAGYDPGGNTEQVFLPGAVSESYFRSLD